MKRSTTAAKKKSKTSSTSKRRSASAPPPYPRIDPDDLRPRSGESEDEFYKRFKRLSRRLEVPKVFIERGREVAQAYTIILEPYEGSGYKYRGRTLELPYVMGFGRTTAECTSEVLKAQAGAVGGMLWQGQTPPPPATEGKRDEQVNIKLTRREKAFFTEAARREGFRSVADFMRSSAMQRLR